MSISSSKNAKTFFMYMPVVAPFKIAVNSDWPELNEITG